MERPYLTKLIPAGITLDVQQYETTTDALNRFAQKYDIAPYRLSLSIENQVQDIVPLLKKLSFEELRSELKAGLLFVKFHRITKPRMIMIWFLNAKNSYDFIDNAYLLSTDISYRNKEIFLTTVQKEYTEISESLNFIRDKISTMYENISKLPEAPLLSDRFDIEFIERQFIIELPSPTLLELFNRIRATKQSPAVILRLGDKTFCKVDMLSPPHKVEDIAQNAITVFLFIANSLVPVTIFETGEVRIKTPLTISVNYILDRFRTIMEIDSLTLLYSYDYKLWGKFHIESEIDLPVLFDLIANDKLIEYFMFIDETKKSALTKDRNYIKYLPGHVLRDDMAFSPQGEAGNIILGADRPITLLFTNIFGGIDIRVSLAENNKQVMALMYVLSRIIKYANKNAKKIRSIYNKVYPLPDLITEKRVESKDSKRAKELRKARPEKFDTSFSTVCQKDFQPRIIIGDEKAKTFLQDELDGDEHKMINFPLGSSDYYVCLPRDDDDKRPNAIWPGLKSKDRKSGDQSEASMYPCCFVADQYMKKKALWRIYKDGIDADSGPSGRDFRYILGSTKRIPPGRRGYLPVNMQQLFLPGTAINEDTSLLRYGVQVSPDSFLLAIAEVILSDASGDERLEKVNELRDALSIVEGEYVNPLAVCSQVEDIIGCHILIFTLEDLGDVLYPNAEIAYIPSREFFENTIILVLSTPRVKDYQYQTEYVSASSASKAENPLFETKQLASVFSILREIHMVYALSPTNTKLVVASTFSSKITGQVIDSFNKLRGIVYYNIPIVVFPTSPLFNVPRIDTLPFYDGKELPKSMFEIGHMIDGNGTNVGIVVRGTFGEGVIPLVKASSPYIPSEKLDVAEPLLSYLSSIRREESKLEKLKYIRRVSEILCEMAVFGKMHLPKMNFVIDADYKYELKEFDYRFGIANIFWRKKNLIIPDEETKEKLIEYTEAFIRTHGFNNPSIKEGNILACAFSRTGDFDLRNNEALFTSFKELERGWHITDKLNLQIIGYIPKHRIEPYIFKHEVWSRGIVCLLQFVFEGSKARASAVAKNWQRKGINTGYLTQPIDDEVDVMDFSSLDAVSGLSDRPTVIFFNDEYIAILPLARRD